MRKFGVTLMVGSLLWLGVMDSYAAPRNRKPVIGADSASTAAGVAVSINVLANDSDPDGNTITLNVVGSPGNGSTAKSGNAVIYTPAAGFSGNDSFSYNIKDSGGLVSSNGTVTVTVMPPPNTNPVANSDAASTTAPNAVTINLLANDTDADGDALSVTSNTQGSQGSVVVSGGTATYTPNAGTSGTDSFSYSISDGKGGTSSSTVTVSVAPEPTTLTTTGGAVLSWTVPTTREDGSPLAPTDLAGYEIYVLAEATGESNVISVTDPLATQYDVAGLAPGVYYFSMAALDTAGNKSALSAVVSKKVE